MKKKFFLLSAFLFLFIVLYFWAFNKPKDVTLNLMVLGVNKEKVKSLANSYTEKTGIKVNVEEAKYFNFISELEEMKKRKEKIPDIFVAINDQIPPLVEKDVIIPIDKNEIIENMPLALDSVKYNGQYYGYPFQFETTYIFYNKDYIKEIPDSFEALLKETKEIEEKSGGKIRGMLFPIDEYYYHYIWLTYTGGSLDNMLTPTGDSKAALIKELKFAKENFKYSNYATTTSLFKDGKAAVMINGNWAFPFLQEVNFKYDYTILNDKANYFAGVKSFVISKSSENIEEAKKLARFLNSYESQKSMESVVDYIPCNDTAIDESKNPALSRIKGSLDKLKLMPNDSRLKDFWMKSNSMLIRVFKNGEEIEAVVTDIFK